MSASNSPRRNPVRSAPRARFRTDSSRVAPVDPLEQHRELRRAHRHRAAQRLRPHEFAIAQAFAEKTYPIAAVPQYFHLVTAAAAKEKNMTRVRTLLQCRLHQRAQS